MTDNKILTPENSPNDEVVGQEWKHAGIVYYCDSYDPSIGYWMTPVRGMESEELPAEDAWGIAPKRKNISERAIYRTYHKIYKYLDD